MQIQSRCRDGTQSYILLFHRLRFGFTSGLPLQQLKKFSMGAQEQLGKTDIKLNINCIKQLQNGRKLNYIVLTEYRQVLPIIYWLRAQPQQPTPTPTGTQCRVLLTKSMYNSSVVYAQDMVKLCTKMNQIVGTPTYDQQLQVLDKYDIHYQMQVSAYNPIYTHQDIKYFMSKCVCVNYGQCYDTDCGVTVTAYPSGMGIGAAVWLFQSISTRNRCLWVQGISHHSWRASRELQLQSIIGKIDNVVFTKGVLQHAHVLTPQQPHSLDQTQCIQFLNAISQRLTKGINTRLVLQDLLIIPDIINYIAIQLKDKFKRLIFTGGSMHNLMSYTNANVQFLTGNHQRRIFQDPPVYPFQTYESLKQKSSILQGTIQEISSDHKVPIKQMILKCTPYIQFITDYHAYLVDGQNQVVDILFEKYYNLERLKRWLQGAQVTKVVCFCKKGEQLRGVPDLGVPFMLSLLGDTVYLPDLNVDKHYIAEGVLPELICSFTKKNGWLKLKPLTRRFRQLKADWHLQVAKGLDQKGIQLILCNDQQISTEKTKIFLKEHRICVESYSYEQLQIVSGLINQSSRLFKLGKF